MTLLTPARLQPNTSTGCRFVHQATSTDPSVAHILIMWDTTLVSFVAELYEPNMPLEREAAFLVMGNDPQQPLRSIEALEDQLGERCQPLSAAIHEHLTSEVLADLCSHLDWSFTPGRQRTFSATTPLSPEAVKLCRLEAFETDEWGRETLSLPFYDGTLVCFREDTKTMMSVCPLMSLTFTPTYQYQFVVTL